MRRIGSRRDRSYRVAEQRYAWTSRCPSWPAGEGPHGVHSYAQEIKMSKPLENKLALVTGSSRGNTTSTRPLTGVGKQVCRLAPGARYGPVLGGRANAILLAFLPVTAIDRRTEPERRILQQARSREWDRRQKLLSSPGAFLNLCEFAIRRHFVGACRFTLIGNSSRRRLWHPPIEPLRMWGTVICNAPFSLYSHTTVRLNV